VVRWGGSVGGVVRGAGSAGLVVSMLISRRKGRSDKRK
jgi:hypothetical protein